MPEHVYRATAAATTVYNSTVDLAWEKRRIAISEFFTRNGLAQETRIYAQDEATGKVEGIERTGPIPAGWRTDRRIPDALVPNRRIKLGKQIAEELAAIPHANGRRLLPGNMPDYCITEHTLMHPSIETLDGHLFVGWPRALPDKVDSRLDGTVWQQVRLSTYHLAKEAAQP